VSQCPLTVHATGPSIGRYGYNTRFISWLKGNARNYDVVIINGLWQFTSFGAWRALRKSDTPYIVFPHGMLDPWFKRHYPLKHLKKWLYWPWGEYRVLRDARAVVFTCEEERVLARQSFWLYRVKERVVAYGTADPVLSDSQRDSFLSRFPSLRGTRYLLFLGRIHRKKGCDLLLKAFANVWGQESDLRLVIAGPDSTRWLPQLQRLASNLGISDRVVWTGALAGDMKWGAFQGAEAFVLPSHQENFGIAVAEALACGLPVLVSDKVNIWREIAGDGAGLI
jgi:glycosyltransferase involved in cell wall biosynthesis